MTRFGNITLTSVMWTHILTITIQAIGPDNKLRAVKMVNSLGMEGEVNKEELRFNRIINANRSLDYKI